MFKHILAMAVAAVLIGAPLTQASAQTATESAVKKTEKKAAPKAETTAAKKLTPQQQKMKDCGAKWQEYKKAHNVKGKAEYQKFLSPCLKG